MRFKGTLLRLIMAVFHILAVIGLLSFNCPVTEAGMAPHPNDQPASPYVVISGTLSLSLTPTHTRVHTHKHLVTFLVQELTRLRK